MCLLRLPVQLLLTTVIHLCRRLTRFHYSFRTLEINEISKELIIKHHGFWKLCAEMLLCCIYCMYGKTYQCIIHAVLLFWRIDGLDLEEKILALALDRSQCQELILEKSPEQNK